MTKPNPSLNEAETFVVVLDDRLQELQRELARHEGAREAVATTLAEAEERAETTGNEAEILDTVLERLTGMGKVWERKFQESTATIVSEGLSLVFGQELELQIKPSTKSDMSAVEFVLVKDGQEEAVMTGQGGGYVNVIAFLLRVLLIVAARPLLRLLLVMDEPFAQLSQEFQEPAAEMVAALIDRLGFQVVMVTHERDFASVADVAYSFGMAGTATQATILKSKGVAAS